MFSLNRIKPIILIMGCLVYATDTSAVEPLGCYNLDAGKFTASVKIPTILTLNASVPTLAILGITNSFASDGAFLMKLPLLGSLDQNLPTDFNGTWQTTRASNFSATFTELSALVQQLQDFGINANVSQSFTGKVTDKVGDKISGKFTIGLSADLQGKTASAKISGTFKGSRSSLDPCPPSSANVMSSASASMPDEGETQKPSALESYIKNMVHPD